MELQAQLDLLKDSDSLQADTEDVAELKVWQRVLRYCFNNLSNYWLFLLIKCKELTPVRLFSIQTLVYCLSGSLQVCVKRCVTH